MALTQAQRASLAKDGTFREYVALALANYADDVLEEAQGAMNAEEHNTRRAFARQVIRGLENVARDYVWFLAQQAEVLTWDTNAYPTVAEFAASIGENAYEAFVVANWSMLAGYYLPSEDVV